MIVISDEITTVFYSCTLGEKGARAMCPLPALKLSEHKTILQVFGSAGMHLISSLIFFSLSSLTKNLKICAFKAKRLG